MCPAWTNSNSAADVLADIYLGKITNWNDARIAKDNPGAKLPDQKIIVVHRVRWQRHQLHLDRLSEQSEQGVGRRTRQRHLASTGRRAWAAKATKA